MNITKSSFGITNDGEEAFLYRLENTSGAYVTITSFGCRVVNICVPDKTGTLRDVCLGYDTLAEYEKLIHIPKIIILKINCDGFSI